MPTYFSSAVLKFVFCCASNQVYSCSFRSVNNVTFSHCHISDLGVRADDFDGFNTCRLAPFFALARGLPHAPQRGGAASALKHADGVRLAHCAHLRRILLRLFSRLHDNATRHIVNSQSLELPVDSQLIQAPVYTCALLLALPCFCNSLLRCLLQTDGPRVSACSTLASRRQAASCNARSSVILVQGASAPVSQRIILMPHFIIVTLCACVL